VALAFSEALPKLLESFPEFVPTWEEELVDWAPDTPTTDYAFGMLESFVLEHMDDAPEDNEMLQRYLDYIELVAEHPDAEVLDIVFGCFLEGMPADFLDGRVNIGPATAALIDKHN